MLFNQIINIVTFIVKNNFKHFFMLSLLRKHLDVKCQFYAICQTKKKV